MNQAQAPQQQAWQQQRQPMVRHHMPQQNTQMNMMQQQTFQPPPVYPNDAPRQRVNFQQQQQVYPGQVMHPMNQQQLIIQAKQHMAAGGKPMQSHILQNQHAVINQSPIDVRSPNPSTVRSPQPIPSPRPQVANATPSPRPMMAGTHQMVQNSSHATMSGVQQHAGMNSDHGNMEVMLTQPQNTQSDSRAQDLLKFVDKL